MKECLQERIRKESSDYFDPYYDYNICVVGLETRPLKPRKNLKVEEIRGKYSSILRENDNGMNLLQARLHSDIDHKNNNQMELFSQN